MPSKYIHKNFKDDIDDSAASSDAVTDIEARFGRSPLEAEQIGVSYFKYGAGYRAPFGHHHREQEEAYVVISGSGKIKLDEEIIDLRQWDVIRVAAEVVRGFEGGPDGLEIIAVGGHRPEGGDGEMTPGWWDED
jgi:mannose-6-phosphate isomerase-like protein (cupin superfamily)